MNRDLSDLASMEAKLRLDATDSDAFRKWLSIAIDVKGDTYIRNLAASLYDVFNDRDQIWVEYLMQNAYFDDAWQQTLHAYSEDPANFGRCQNLLERAVWLGRASEIVDIAVELARDASPWLVPSIGQCFIAANEIESAKKFLNEFIAKGWFPEIILKECALFQLGWIATFEDKNDLAASCRDQILLLRQQRAAEVSASLDWETLLAEAKDDGRSSAVKSIMTAITSGDGYDHACRVATIYSELASVDRSCSNDNLNADASRFIIFSETEDGNAQAISRLGLSPAFVRLNGLDDEFIEKFDYRGHGEWQFADLPSIGLKDFFFGRYGGEQARGSWRPISMIRRALKTGKLKAICPWTGICLESDESYASGADLIYRFKGKEVFYIFSLGFFPCRDALYVPSLNYAIGFWGHTPDWKVIECATHAKQIETSPQRVDAENSSAKTLAALIGISNNMGHHYMNELSGLERIVAQGLVGRSAKLIIGPIDFYDAGALYGEHFSEVIRCNSLEDIGTAVRDRGLFVVRPHDAAAYRSLSERICRSIRAPVGGAWDELRDALQDKEVVVLFTLRRVRRSWRGQEAGIASLMRKLADAVPGIAFVFDGMTKTASTPKEQEWIEEDQKLFSAISERADTLGVRARRCSIIGWSVNDKIAAYEHVDVGVVPKGNGHLPNLSWVVNLPCVVHSNSWDIRAATWEAILREDARAPRVLDRSTVSDAFKVEAGVPPVDRQHVVEYDVNLESMYSAIMEIIKKI